ncbi:MAG: acylphosphatase [Chloroflexota bacterium]|nr:MAG: acylphosphatase [Chloroflexota bacterium]
MSRKRLHIYGQVQGVGFRYYMRQRAGSLQLGGWVRNCPDGSVEAVVDGPDEAVESLVAWARGGPSGAGVETVQVKDDASDEALTGFRITSA